MTQIEGSRVLVTGGAGFIGSHLVDALVEQDAASVVVVDNLVTGAADNLEGALNDPRVRLDTVDARESEHLEALLAETDLVFHLACLGVRHSLHDPQENHAVNATLSLSLVEQARRAGVRRYVHVSSSEVYGSAQYAPMDEGHPTFPETVYGASKLAGEAYARAAFRTHGFPALVVRPFNAYGPRSHFEGDSGEVIPRTIVRALCDEAPIIYGDGEQSRDFTHVTDTARGIIALAESDEAIGQTVNVGSGADITINRLASVVTAAAGREDLLPMHLDPRPGDVRRLLAESSQMTAMTGYAPRVDFADGVRDLVEWFRSRPTSPQEMLARIEDRNWEKVPR
ncbi:dTDP-glucose 4,6-dehydratase [Microbacterium sp. NPDC055312]